MSAAIQAIICDFGGVLTTPLINGFLAFQERSGVSLETLGAALGTLEERDGTHPLTELETGRLTEAKFLTDLEAELTHREQRPISLHDFGRLYFEHLHPNQLMIDYVTTLKQRGYRMALCTNNVREWESMWRAMLPVEEIFNIVVDSAFVGMRKPDPEIYELTLQRLAVEPHATVFIDDFEVNCETARKLGMRAVHFESAEQALPEIEQALSS
jgi:putative hydrolase of the HAD superfamily